jgi:hypothetical protein
LDKEGWQKHGGQKDIFLPAIFLPKKFLLLQHFAPATFCRRNRWSRRRRYCLDHGSK